MNDNKFDYESLLWHINFDLVLGSTYTWNPSCVSSRNISYTMYKIYCIRHFMHIADNHYWPILKCMQYFFFHDASFFFGHSALWERFVVDPPPTSPIGNRKSAVFHMVWKTQCFLINEHLWIKDQLHAHFLPLTQNLWALNLFVWAQKLSHEKV